MESVLYREVFETDVRNKEVAKLLGDIADLLEIKGESAFRVGAYREAARRIEGLSFDVETLSAQGRLQEIQGVGESLAARIDEYLKVGGVQYLEDLKAAIPAGLVELLQVPGLGPKKVKLVYEKLGVMGIDDLEKAAHEHRLQALPGMGEKSEDKLIRELERWRNRSRRLLLGDALPRAEAVAEMLQGCPAARQVEPSGSIRRRQETIGDIDILASSDSPEELMACFNTLPIVKEVIAHGPTKSSVLSVDDLQIDLRVVKPESFGSALQYFTGSKNHNVKLRELALKRGLKINEYGIFEGETGRRIGGNTEEEIYNALGLACMPPELREDRGEIEAATADRLPDLIEMGDIEGDLHVHTDWSDGHNTLEEVARAAMAKGYSYLAICDHSKSLGVAHGLSIERVREQRQDIDELNERLHPFRILAGIEMDIRADGTLDYDDEVLKEFDIVSASIHFAMGQPVDKITQRVIAAMRNPYVDVFNHPTGRIIGRRYPYEIDLEAVFAVAAETHTALEINAAPDRLDLNDISVRRAKELGVMIAINTDAHAIPQLEFMRYGVATARRGWIEKPDVLNALPLPELLARLKRSRSK